ncbi:hypothetical protein P692DRAFT_20842235 [Suillus brevipes Sb2]|nr:hypothetical protein P692DRAFT_20842235 [Suillus brevipes Sb2]
MGSSSSLDLSTSSLPDILSLPTPQPRLQLQTLHKCLFRQHPIPFFIFPPNHGKRTRVERIISRTLLYNHAFTRAPPLLILRHALITASPAVKCISQKRSGKNVVRPAALSEKQRKRAGVHFVLAARKIRAGRRWRSITIDNCCC